MHYSRACPLFHCARKIVVTTSQKSLPFDPTAPLHSSPSIFIDDLTTNHVAEFIGTNRRGTFRHLARVTFPSYPSPTLENRGHKSTAIAATVTSNPSASSSHLHPPRGELRYSVMFVKQPLFPVDTPSDEDSRGFFVRSPNTICSLALNAVFRNEDEFVSGRVRRSIDRGRYGTRLMRAKSITFVCKRPISAVPGMEGTNS